MTALAKDRNTRIRGEITSLREYKVAASTKIYKGGMVALNSAGYAVPAANTAGLRVIGICEEQADNSAGAAGAIDVKVMRGLFELANGTQALALAQIDSPCLVQDDQTVGKGGAATTKGIIAGTFKGLDPSTSLPWVDMSSEAWQQDVGSETVTVNAGAGVIDPLVRTTKLDITGTCTATLADGIAEGQIKEIIVIAGAPRPAPPLPPATPGGLAILAAIGALGDSAVLRWHTGVGWVLVASNGVTVA